MHVCKSVRPDYVLRVARPQWTSANEERRGAGSCPPTHHVPPPCSHILESALASCKQAILSETI